MRALLVVGLAGCSSIFGLKSPQGPVDAASEGGDAPDAAVDSAIDGVIDAPLCYGSGDYAVCFDALPTSTAMLAGAFTTTSATCSTSVHWVSPNQPAACFVTGTSVTVASLTATGPLPLVIVATNSVTLDQLVDVSSHRTAATPGAGAGAGGCGTPGPAVENNNGGGGGAGGSFATVGGDGGNGSNAAPGGTPAPNIAIDVLHGGCAGGAGAKGGAGTSGAPGAGGGALYIVAGSSISLENATLAANGAGAELANNRFGGSGGGTGGMIVLSAPSISATSAVLMANGGGGAAGSTGGQSSAGQDPNPTAPTTPAPGGTSGVNGPSGGAGFARNAPAGNGVSMGALFGTGGGGGGGGGAGYIRANVTIAGITASPAVDVVP